MYILWVFHLICGKQAGGPAECCLRAQGGPRTAAAPLTRIPSTPPPGRSASRQFRCCLRKHKDYFQAANPQKSWDWEGWREGGREGGMEGESGG